MLVTREQLKEITGCNYYNGDVIHERFAYKFFKKNVTPVGNIVAFRAPMEVTDNLIDLEDSLNKDYIYSDDAINFCIEIPNIDLYGGVAFQRLFNTQIAFLLTNYVKDYAVTVDGDDILFTVGEEQKKASVSIAAQKNGAVLIHTAINVSAGNKAPDFAFSTNLTDEECEEFAKKVCEQFYAINQDIFVATTKVVV